MVLTQWQLTRLCLTQIGLTCGTFATYNSSNNDSYKREFAGQCTISKKVSFKS